MAYKGDTDDLPEWAKNSVSVPILESTLIWTNKNIDLKTMIKTVDDKLQKINFDKTAKDTGDELKAEVKKEETNIQKSEPETPPPAVPVPPVSAAPVPSTPAPAPLPAGKGPAPTPDASTPPAATAP